MKQIISILLFILLLSSCSQKQDESARFEMGGIQEEIIPITRQESVSPPPPPLPPVKSEEVIKKKIIKDGRMGVKVNELEEAKARVDAVVESYDGYYANESFNNSDYESSYQLKIRIPSDRFEQFIAAVEKGEGEILFKEIEARDVTDEFIDLETRLENKRSYLKRYTELLKKATSVKDILEIEEKIRGLEEEIESATGRLKYLTDLVGYSTLDLSIFKQKGFKYNPVNRDRFTERLKQSLSKGWFGLVDFLLFAIKIWPLWIFLLLFFGLWMKFKKRKD